MVSEEEVEHEEQRLFFVFPYQQELVAMEELAFLCGGDFCIFSLTLFMQLSVSLACINDCA